MRRINDDPIARFGLDPAFRRAPTGKNKRVNTASLDHRQFEIPAKRRRRDRFPYCLIVHC